MPTMKFKVLISHVALKANDVVLDGHRDPGSEAALVLCSGLATRD